MPATSLTPVRVFISHKHHDGPEVKEIAGQLQRYARKRPLRCFVSDYDIHNGEDWRQRIRRELRRSNMLLLLYTDPSQNWDWCLYEAGLFTRLDAERVKPVVCVYAGDQPPGPLDNLQGVPAADPGGVRRFLERFFKSTELFVAGYADPDAPGAQLPCDAKIDSDRPLNERIREDTLDKLTAAICSRFGRTRSSHPCHRLVLEVAEPAEEGAAPTPDEALAGARVVESTPETLPSIFGRDHRGSTWTDLVRSIDPLRPQRWARELADRFRAVVEGDVGQVTFCPITTTFRGRDGRIYCPELYRVDLDRDEAGLRDNGITGGVMQASRVSRIVIIFDSLDAPTVVGDTVFNLIRANFRFRDEVFAVYAGQLWDRIERERQERGVGHGEAREAVFRSLDEAMRLIEHEADIHGFFDDARLAKAYGRAPARWQRVQELGGQWLDRAGGLKEALGRQDIALTEEHLGELARLNWEFSAITAEQHRDMMLAERNARVARPAERPACAGAPSEAGPGARTVRLVPRSEPEPDCGPGAATPDGGQRMTGT